MQITIITQGLRFDLTGQWLETLYSDGSIAVDPLTSEEASLYQAQHGY